SRSWYAAAATTCACMRHPDRRNDPDSVFLREALRQQGVIEVLHKRGELLRTFRPGENSQGRCHCRRHHLFHHRAHHALHLSELGRVWLARLLGLEREGANGGGEYEQREAPSDCDGLCA